MLMLSDKRMESAVTRGFVVLFKKEPGDQRLEGRVKHCGGVSNSSVPSKERGAKEPNSKFFTLASFFLRFSLQGGMSPQEPN